MGFLSELLKNKSQQPFTTQVAFVFLVDDDAKKMMRGLPGGQFTPEALGSCKRLRAFRLISANASGVPDESGSIYDTFILPTTNSPSHIGDVSVSVAYQDNGHQTSPAILPKIVSVGNSAGDILIVNTVSCCVRNAYGASLIEFDEDSGEMKVTAFPSSSMAGKTVVGFNGKTISVGEIYQYSQVELMDQHDPLFTHFIQHQQNPKHCNVPGFGPGYRG